MNFRTLQDHSLERLNHDQTLTNSTPRTRIKYFLNEWHRRILSEPALQFLRDDVVTFPTVANQARYALPQAISRVNRMYEPTTNRIRLIERSLDWLRMMPSTTQGVPEAWIPLGLTQVAKQPAGTGLWVVSDSVSDTTQKAYIEGFRTGQSQGDQVVASATTLNGTTRVQVGSLTDFIEVDKFFIDSVGVGNISLYDAAVSGNLLATIPIGIFHARYWTILMWPTPANVWTMYVDYTRTLTDLTQDGDVPLLPSEFHWLLEAGARLSEYEYKKDWAAYKISRAEFDDGLKAMREYVVNNPDKLIVPGQQPRSTRFSNLGSYFPSGTW